MKEAIVSAAKCGVNANTDDVRFVRLLWCDAAGVRRCRVVPIKTFPDVLLRGIGLTKGCMAMPVYGDVCIEGTGIGPVGEVRLIPESDKPTTLPWRRTHAVAIVDMHETPGTPWDVCPRTALKRVLQHAEGCGVRLLVGFELEFLLLQRPQGNDTNPLKAVDSTLYAQSSAVEQSAEILDDMVTSLESMGIPVLQYHAESAPGQFEIALAPFPALEAADKLLLAREAVCAVARVHGVAASFIPKLGRVNAGSGCHCHFSLVDEEGGSKMLSGRGENGELSEEANAFLAGILSHLPALLPWTAPSTVSYSRLQAGCWAGAHRCWGYDNRECPLRVTSPPGSPGKPPSTNAELKAFDGSTNPHLGLAAMVVAGLHGISSGAKLPPPLQSDPGTLLQHELAELGIECLPDDLSAAIKAFSEDEAFSAAMKKGVGEALVKAFMAVRLAEANRVGVIDSLFKY